MFPTLDCDQQLDDYIIKAINELYNEPSLPDLAVVKANATKEGRYVSFAVEVMNKGLVGADNVKLEVREGDNLIKTFELQTLSIGVRKTLTVENLRASREGSEIQLKVVSNSAELDENNNYMTLGAN
jgi:heme-binding NEAT domain protein